MTRFVYLLLMLTCLCTTRNALALDLYALGSYWQTEDSDDIWGAGVGVAIPLLTEHLRLDGRAYYFEDNNVDNDDKLELIPVDFGLQIHLFPDSDLDPYILGGASYVYADSDRLDLESEFGAYAGAGLDFELFTGLKLFGEVLYRSSELSSERGALEEQLDVSGVSANAGFKIHF